MRYNKKNKIMEYRCYSLQLSKSY